VVHEAIEIIRICVSSSVIAYYRYWGNSSGHGICIKTFENQQVVICILAFVCVPIIVSRAFAWIDCSWVRGNHHSFSLSVAACHSLVIHIDFCGLPSNEPSKSWRTTFICPVQSISVPQSSSFLQLGFGL
jgi:hypothetical protein